MWLTHCYNSVSSDFQSEPIRTDHPPQFHHVVPTWSLMAPKRQDDNIDSFFSDYNTCLVFLAFYHCLYFCHALFLYSISGSYVSGPPEVKFRTELSRRIKRLWFQSVNKLIHDTEHVNMRVSVAVMCAPVPRLSERYRQEYLCLCSVVCPRLMRVRRLCQKTNRIVCVSLSLTFNNPIHPHESMRDSRAVVMAPRASVSSFHFIIVLRINSNWISPECCHHCWFYIVLI